MACNFKVMLRLAELAHSDKAAYLNVCPTTCRNLVAVLTESGKQGTRSKYIFRRQLYKKPSVTPNPEPKPSSTRMLAQDDLLKSQQGPS